MAIVGSGLTRRGGRLLPVFGGVAGPTLTAPVLTKTSAAGANPIAFTISVDATVAIGNYWHLQVASDSGFTTNLRDETRLIVSDDFASGNASFTSLTNMLDGATYVRLRVERDDDAQSSWSNVLFDTLASIPSGVQFDAATKNTVAPLPTNGNLTITGEPSAGFFQSVKLNYAKNSGSVPNDRGYVEFVYGTTVGSAGGRIIGIYEAAQNTNSSSAIPGASGVGGIAFNSISGYGEVRVNGVTYTVGVPTNVADGSVVGLYWNATLGRVWFHSGGTWFAANGDPNKYYVGGSGTVVNGSNVLTVTVAPTTGTLQVGSMIRNPNNVGGATTTITALGTGTGGMGTYTMSVAAYATGSTGTLDGGGFAVTTATGAKVGAGAQKNNPITVRATAASQTYRGTLQPYGQ